MKSIGWLTANAPWDPLGLSEALDPTLPVPLGYTYTLGTMDLLDLDLEWENIAPVQTGKELTQDQVADELTQALRYINFSQCTQADIYVNQATPKDDEYQKYQPFLGWKPLEVIKRTFEATNQFAAVCFSPPLCRHYKSRFPTFHKPRLREMFFTDT